MTKGNVAKGKICSAIKMSQNIIKMIVGAQQNFAEFYESFQTKLSIKLKWNQRFLERWFKASCSAVLQSSREICYSIGKWMG